MVRIFFTDGIVFDGSEYYTRSFADSVDYSLTAGEVAAENSLCVPGRYGMVGDSVEYRHRFGDCEVTDGRNTPEVLKWYCRRFFSLGNGGRSFCRR